VKRVYNNFIKNSAGEVFPRVLPKVISRVISRVISKSLPISGVFFVMVFGIFLNSCSLFVKEKIILWTDQPEAAAYVEYFNSLHNFSKVEICYKENILKELSDIKKQPAAQHPDLVMGYRLNSLNSSENYRSLDKLLGDDKIDPKNFYTGILSTGRENGRQMLLPVSFNLPTLIFNRKINEKVSSITISLDEIKNLCKEFNKTQGSHLKKLGFSPFWNEDFIYYVAVLFGNSFSKREEGNINVEDAKIKDAQNYIFSWIKEINGGYKIERAFTEKYINVPMYKLVDDGRILFAFISSKDLLSIPEEKRKDLTFRWLSYKDKIPVEDDILYAGISAAAENRRGAEIFMKWLFTPSVQKELIKINHFKRLNIFGVCNGFSAFKKVTEREIPNESQMFLGHIPPADFLIFPEPKPADWNSTKERLISEWFVDEKK